MSTVKTLVVLVGVWFGLGLGFANLAKAATPIEFEFGGVFTQTNGTVFQPGQSFTTTVRFDPDAPDMNPSPLLGEYTYLTLTVPYRISTPLVLVPPSGAIRIFRDSGGHGWQVFNEGASQFFFQVALDFPVGTFATDELVQTLDLSRATRAEFRGLDASVGFEVTGNINSFRVVPEPASAVLGLLVALICSARRRSLLGTNKRGHHSFLIRVHRAHGLVVDAATTESAVPSVATGVIGGCRALHHGAADARRRFADRESHNRWPGHGLCDFDSFDDFPI